VPCLGGHFDSNPGGYIPCNFGGSAPFSYEQLAAGFGSASLSAQPGQPVATPQPVAPPTFSVPNDITHDSSSGSYQPHVQQIGSPGGSAAADPWSQVIASSSPMWSHRILPDNAGDGDIETREAAQSEVTNIDYAAAVVSFLAGADSDHESDTL